MIISNDGTFKDFCQHYGADCGGCYGVANGFPKCFEGFLEEDELLEQYIEEHSSAERG